MIFLLLTLALTVHAAPQEAPPMEPPYTNDSEFDPLAGEDPSATSSSSIPTSPSVQPAKSVRPSPSTAQSPLDEPEEAAEMPPSRSNRPPHASAVSKKGVKMIPHPNAKKGLVRIEQNGTYVYKTKMTVTENMGTLRFGKMEAPTIVSADGSTDFATMYQTESLPMIMFDYNWLPFKNFGKLGVDLGIGFAMVNGKGRFLLTRIEAMETYTFIVVPLNLGVTYRFQYARKQWVAPYVSGGGTYIALAEVRDDNKRNFTGTPAFYGAGGLMFNIAALDRDVAFALSNEYGVGGLWVTGEYRYQKAASEDIDFNGSIITLGISAEY